MSTRAKLGIRLSAFLGVPAALIAVTLLVVKAGDVAHWGARIETVEQATKSLAAGQSDISRRVDLMAGDMTAMRRELADNYNRMSTGHQMILSELAKVNGVLGTITEASARIQERIVSATQKAIDAQVKVDTLEDRVTQHMIEQEKAHNK